MAQLGTIMPGFSAPPVLPPSGGPGANLNTGVSRVKAPAAPKAPAPLDVTGMQKLLAQHGYQIPVDGLNGPLTQAAAADFRGSRNPAAFNVGHGLAHGAGPTVVPGVSSTPTATSTPVPTKPVLAATKTAPKPATKPAAKTAAKPAAPVPTAAASDQATATSTINAIIAPLIKQITDAENQRASQGSGLISGYTKDAMAKLAGIDFGAPAAGAAGQESAVNSALLAQLQGQGSGLQNELGATLAKAGADPAFAASLTGKVGADTAGAGGAELAKGDATLSQLLGESAAAKTYGQKLGPITSLAGAQDTSKLLGQVASDSKTQLGDISSKVPAMVQSELSTLSTARSEAEKTRIAQIISEGYDPNTGQLTPSARAALASATGYDPTTGQPTARTQVAQTNAATAQNRAANAAKPKASAALSKQSGVLTDTYGNPILRNGKPVPVSASGTALSADAAAKLNATAEKDAENLYHGVTKTSSSGATVVVSYSVPYQEAITTLVNRYPSLGLKGAIKLANSLYPAGGTFPGGQPNGRPANPPRGTVAPPGYQPGTSGRAPSTPANPGGFLPKGG